MSSKFIQLSYCYSVFKSESKQGPLTSLVVLNLKPLNFVIISEIIQKASMALGVSENILLF